MRTSGVASRQAQQVERRVLHPWVTAAQQSRVLGEVLRRVEVLNTRGKRGVVQIDLDLTALRPIERTRTALKTIAARFGVPALATATPLPGYTDGAWETFLSTTGLDKRHPTVDWKALYREFRAAYWYGDKPGASRDTGYVGLERDVPTAGLVDFVKRVRAAGGEVVFNSGRGEQAEQGTLAALKRAGLSNPILAIGSDPNLHGGEVKALRQKQLDALGTTVAVIDDRLRNREALAPETKGALHVAIAVPGFTAEAPTATTTRRISTFEG